MEKRTAKFPIYTLRRSEDSQNSPPYFNNMIEMGAMVSIRRFGEDPDDTDRPLGSLQLNEIRTRRAGRGRPIIRGLDEDFSRRLSLFGEDQGRNFSRNVPSRIDESRLPPPPKLPLPPPSENRRDTFYGPD